MLELLLYYSRWRLTEEQYFYWIFKNLIHQVSLVADELREYYG